MSYSLCSSNTTPISHTDLTFIREQNGMYVFGVAADFISERCSFKEHYNNCTALTSRTDHDVNTPIGPLSVI